ncbi:hypothetical protein [Glaciimonas immobilis]|uniref:Uncharacterized protein n=1 Tax=Glaciimonas immobilis TaxID=728004 RepID=A0A840RWI0_9BURK|nr:hypothetical protein [Glaciimonas immobilis]KAF3996436.1 hypothetical protein HAV38_17435 [Glaciimonas immobilis]MBB5201226.1 hypothetical protein [Glaciimonas immobilis]
MTMPNSIPQILPRIVFNTAMSMGLFGLGGCTVVTVASMAVGATVAVGSAAVGVATTVVSGTVKAGGAVVGAVVD